MHQFLKFILKGNSTCFGQFLCPSSGIFHCTHGNGICHTGLLTACEQEHMNYARSHERKISSLFHKTLHKTLQLKYRLVMTERTLQRGCRLRKHRLKYL